MTRKGKKVKASSANLARILLRFEALLSPVFGLVEGPHTLLYEQLEKIAPRRARKPREGSHWWTPELSSKREELKYLLAHKSNLTMVEKLWLVQRSYSYLYRKERSNSWHRFCSKAELVKDVITLVQIVCNNKIRGVSLLRQGGAPSPFWWRCLWTSSL